MCSLKKKIPPPSTTLFNKMKGDQKDILFITLGTAHMGKKNIVVGMRKAMII